MAGIVKLSGVNPSESVFELRADSLDTLLLIARLQAEVKITVTLDQLRLYATPAAICKLSSQSKSMAVLSNDLSDDWIFDPVPDFSSVSTNGDAVFITGVTGFLGSHILAELLEHKDYRNRKIVCLVRCDSASHGAERIN